MDKPKQNPIDRGMQDYRFGIYFCPYPPKSKAAKKWKEGQEFEAVKQATAEGAYDDGGAV